MLERGATTLWEHWEFSDDTYSHNHPMFGSVSEWLFAWVAGIQPDPAASAEGVSFRRIEAGSCIYAVGSGRYEFSVDSLPRVLTALGLPAAGSR